MKQSSLNLFRDHANGAYPHECCGLLVVTQKGEQYLPCDNVATSKNEEFRIAPEAYAAAEDSGTIIGICHSHPDATSQPSNHDLAMCEATALPWHIISWPEGDLRTIVPTGEIPPLLGRPFVHGVWDCYALIKDWYQLERGITLPEFTREDGWWEGDQELYLDNYADAGFSPVPESDLKPGDVILMQIQSKRVNHAAVYLGDNHMLHHLYGRLSRRDPYGGYWQRNTRLIVRKTS